MRIMSEKVNAPNIDFGNAKRVQLNIGINGDYTFNIQLLDNNHPINLDNNIEEKYLTLEDIIKAIATVQVVNLNEIIMNGLRKIEGQIENNIEISDEELNTFLDGNILPSLIQYDQLIADIKLNSMINFLCNEISKYEPDSVQYKYLQEIVKNITGNEDFLKPDELTS